MTAIGAAIAIVFSAGALAAKGMSENEYKAGKDKIEAEYESAKATCDALSANAKDVCVAEAKGKQKVAKVELEASSKPTDKNRVAVGIAKAEAEYAVAKEKCDDKADNNKKACVKEAKVAETRAKAEAKTSIQTSDATTPAKEKSTTSASKRESPGEYVDDAVITGKVKAAVLEEASLKSAEINVETLKGTVQLSGFVRSRGDINKAVEVAKGVKGVQSVKNDMRLKEKQ
jgi:osmotically-inducible protein OsmY